MTNETLAERAKEFAEKTKLSSEMVGYAGGIIAEQDALIRQLLSRSTFVCVEYCEEGKRQDPCWDHEFNDALAQFKVALQAAQAAGYDGE